MKQKCPSLRSSLPLGIPFALLLIALSCASACGGSKAVQSIGLPTPPPVTQVNSYVGQAGDSSSLSSLWSITIDRSKNTYSYGPVSGAATTSGSIAILNNNFIILLGPGGYQSGLAVEVPGQAVIVRAGDSTTPLFFAVKQASCFAVGGNVKFLYALSPGLSGPNTAFFGEIYGATSSDGSNWQFNNQTNLISPYVFQVQEHSTVPSDAAFPGYPGAYSGTCSAASGAASVNASPMAYFDNGRNSYSVPTELVISPGGYFFENQNYANVPSIEGWQYPNVTAWGVSEPVTPIGTSAAAANYVGFLFEYHANNGTFRTRLVGFGNAGVSGTVMDGGTFPNGDPTQVPATNMSLTFNSEDPLNHGVYYLAKLTIPNDAPNDFTGSCLTYGVSPTGTPTCTNDGVALVSKPNGLYSVMMSASDTSGNQQTLVLFQQSQ